MAVLAQEGAGTTQGRRRRGPRPWSAFLFGLVLGVVGLGSAGLVIGGPIILLHRNNLPLEKAYGDGAVGIAARLAAGNQQNPLAQMVPHMIFNFPGSATGRTGMGAACTARPPIRRQPT